MDNTMKMEPISSKLYHDEKQTFIETCNSIGTTPSNAIRMFVSAFNRRGGFPFDPSNPYGFNSETLLAMDEASQGRNLYGPYNNAAEMFADILDEAE